MGFHGGRAANYEKKLKRGRVQLVKKTEEALSRTWRCPRCNRVMLLDTSVAGKTTVHCTWCNYTANMYGSDR